jgi:DNA-binding transcriptional regulator YbjK
VAEADRRTTIADAALRLLGALGARGLTHRAVDAEAGLPEGSTSYYCRRRADLLALVLQRHAELDHQALSALELALRAAPRRGQSFAEHIAHALSAWVRGLDSAQIAARFELFLAASREPELTRGVEEARKRFVATLSAGLRGAAVASPRTVAAAIIALIEGLLLERLRLGRATLRPRELTALLEALFAASSDAEDPQG